MKELNDLKIYNSLNPSSLTDTVLHCPECGHDHKIPIKVIRVGENLVSSIPGVIKEIVDLPVERIGVVYDRHIGERIDNLFFVPFMELGLPFLRVPLGEKGKLLDPSDEIGNTAAKLIPNDVDFLIGVGSGVISDLTKWIATKLGVPFMLMGTAASMNAYTSITGTITEENVKTTKWLDPASAVLLDTVFLASAPVEMTQAGIADLLARNIANADWKLSAILRGNYFCSVPYDMMTLYQREILSLVETLGKNDQKAMMTLGQGVLVSGYSMTVLDGETSPSSGSEHVISHFFDFQQKIFNLHKNLHGAQVGLGTIIMSTAYEMLKEIDPSELDIDDIERRRLSKTALKLDHQRVFGEYAQIFDHVTAKKRIPDVSYRKYITEIITSWEEIWQAVSPYLMPAEEIKNALEQCGAVTTLSGVQRTFEEAVQALLYGSSYRPRYTILDLYWELGLFPQLAPVVLEKSGVVDLGVK